MKISSLTQTVVCSHIMTGDGQYLTDHHNRDNEILISCLPQKSRKGVIELLISDTHSTDKLPDWISDRDFIEAIICMVNRLTSEDCYPSYYRELEKEDYDSWLDCDIRIWAYLSW